MTPQSCSETASDKVMKQSNLPDLSSLSSLEGQDKTVGCVTKRTCNQHTSLVDASIKMCTVDSVCVAAKQKELNARTERLLRRLRRLQTREANSFVKQQLSQVIAFFHRSKGEGNTEENGDSHQSLASVANFQSMSTSQLVGLVRRMQSAEGVSSFTETVPVDMDISLEMAATAGQLKGSLKHLESAVDSDATESSSGGESDDEPVAHSKVREGFDEKGANNIV
jgi:hypothetical protein